MPYSTLSRHASSLGLWAAAGLAGMLAFAPRASAADLDPGYADVPPPMTQQQLQFGSGWYVRGDIGATRLPEIDTRPPAVLPTRANPSAIPSAPDSTIREGSQAGYVASLGAGYQLNNWIRADIIGDYNQPLNKTTTAGNGQIFCPTGVNYAVNPLTGALGQGTYASGGCTGTYKSRLDSYDVLVNGYVDLGTWYNITPYIGAGVGLSFGHYSSSATYNQANGQPYQITYHDAKYGQDFAPNFDRSSSGNYYNLAYAFMGGFAYDIYPHVKLDVGYRYLNLGRIEKLGTGTLTSQQVRAGIRYMIDN